MTGGGEGGGSRAGGTGEDERKKLNFLHFIFQPTRLRGTDQDPAAPAQWPLTSSEDVRGWGRENMGPPAANLLLHPVPSSPPHPAAERWGLLPLGPSPDFSEAAQEPNPRGLRSHKEQCKSC